MIFSNQNTQPQNPKDCLSEWFINTVAGKLMPGNKKCVMERVDGAHFGQVSGLKY